MVYRAVRFKANSRKRALINLRVTGKKVKSIRTIKRASRTRQGVYSARIKKNY